MVDEAFLERTFSEQLAEVPTNVFQDRIQQRTLEQISGTLVPQVVVVLVEVFTHFSRDRVQQRSGELIFHTLAISLAVKRATFARCCLYPVELLLICLRRTRNPLVGHTDAPRSGIRSCLLVCCSCSWPPTFCNSPRSY